MKRVLISMKKFYKDSLKLITDFFQDRKQVIKI